MTKENVLQHRRLTSLLECLHLEIDDPQQSAIAISFGCGHFADPDDCPGLSHLLEHMLFMGSDEYPDANGAVSFIEQLGGSINASTGSENMTFICRFPNEQLSTVLHCLANIVGKPLLRTADIENEINTIDAEFQFKRQDDLRRLYQVHKETSNPKHPFSKFSVGNKSIFGQFSNTELQSKLQGLHNQFFTTGNCRIALLSNIDIDTAIAAIETQFQTLRTGPTRAPAVLPDLYQADQKGVLIKVQSLSDARRLIVTFPIPRLSITDIEALSFISHLLGDEGSGSILQVLKNYNWITSLSAGGGIEGSSFKDFNINMQLTEEGEKHIPHIVHTIVAYIRLIDNDENMEWRITEKQRLSKLYASDVNVGADVDIASQYAEGLLRFSFEELQKLHTNTLYAERRDVLSLLDFFNLNKIRLKHINSEPVEGNRAAFYQTPYTIFPLDAKTLSLWANQYSGVVNFEELTLPQKNPYIGRIEERRQQLNRNSELTLFSRTLNSELWWAAYTEPDSNKADAYLSIECPSNLLGPQILSAKRLWLACLNDQLQQRFYAAEVAGLNYRLYGHQGGLTIHTSGFSYMQKQLLMDLIDAVFNTKDFEQSFARVYPLQLASLRNHLLNKPVNRLFTRLSVLMQRHNHAPQALLEHMQTQTLDEVLACRETLLSEHFLQGFLHGDWREKDAETIRDTLSQHHSKTAAQPVSREVIKLKPQTTFFGEVSSAHRDAAALIFLQAPSNSLLDNALTMVFEQLLATPFFEQLRTRKKLGYVVGSGFTTHNAHPGMAFYIQSPTHDANTLINEMTCFLMGQLEHIDYYAKFWPQIQSNIVRQLCSPDVNSGARAQRLWINLGLKDYSANRSKAIAEHVASLSFEDLVRHAQLLQQRRSFGELVLYSFGELSQCRMFSDRSHAIEIENSEAFKTRLANTP